MALARATVAEDEMSQNVTVQPGSCHPDAHDRTEPDLDESAASDAKPACTALVPLAFTERRARRRWYRWAPDPIFVTHLIAEAQHVPQAQGLAARERWRTHRPLTGRARRPSEGVGSRMRQIVLRS